MCYMDEIKLRKKAFDTIKIAQIDDQKEKCTSECFIPRAGTTDSQYCLEKCNLQYDKELSDVVRRARQNI